MVTISRFRNDEGTREYCLAPDLSVWMPKKTLAGVVLNAVQTLDEATLHPAISGGAEKFISPRIILGVLVYCYSVGIYRSEKIANSLVTDEILQLLCAGSAPDSALIRCFRHLNRAAIEQCLEKVCLVVWKIKHGSWQWHDSGRAEHGGSGSTHHIDPLFQAQVICEVKERLNKAEQLDYGPVEDNPFAQATA